MNSNPFRDNWIYLAIGLLVVGIIIGINPKFSSSQKKHSLGTTHITGVTEEP